MQYNITVLLHFLNDIILDTSPNNVPHFWMRNWHQRLSLYQLLLLFYVDILPKGMNIILIITFLRNIHPMLLPTVFHYDTLLLIQVRISLFLNLFFRNICIYLLNKTQTIKHRQIHTSSKHVRLSNLRIPIYSKQFTLLFLGIII